MLADSGACLYQYRVWLCACYIRPCIGTAYVCICFIRRGKCLRPWYALKIPSSSSFSIRWCSCRFFLRFVHFLAVIHFMLVQLSAFSTSDLFNLFVYVVRCNFVKLLVEELHKRGKAARLLIPVIRFVCLSTLYFIYHGVTRCLGTPLLWLWDFLKIASLWLEILRLFVEYIFAMLGYLSHSGELLATLDNVHEWSMNVSIQTCSESSICKKSKNAKHFDVWNSYVKSRISEILLWYVAWFTFLKQPYYSGKESHFPMARSFVIILFIFFVSWETMCYTSCCFFAFF